MDLELRHLRVLVAIADAGSVSRAANRLRVPQPSLTAQLRRIEATMGGPIFERGPAGVTETPLGQYVIPRARAVLADVDNLHGITQGWGGAEVKPARLGGFPGAPLEGLTARLPKIVDGVEVTTQVDWSTTVLLQLLESDRLDLALLREFPGFELKLPPGVETRTVVAVEPAFVLVNAADPLAEADEVELADLAGVEWMLEPPGDSGLHTVFRDACQAAGFEPAVRHYTVDSSAAVRYVTSGQGVTLVSPTVDGTLVTGLPLADSPVWRRVLLAWRREWPQAGLIDDVVEQAVAAYQDLVRANPRYAAWWDQHAHTS